MFTGGRKTDVLGVIKAAKEANTTFTDYVQLDWQQSGLV